MIAPATAINQGTAQEMLPKLLRGRLNNFYTSCYTSANKAAKSIEGEERVEDEDEEHESTGTDISKAVDIDLEQKRDDHQSKAAESIEGEERREGDDQLITDIDQDIDIDHSRSHSHIDKPYMSIARTGGKARGHRGRPDNYEVSKLGKEDEHEEREGIGTHISKAADMDLEHKRSANKWRLVKGRWCKQEKADDDHQGKFITDTAAGKVNRLSPAM